MTQTFKVTYADLLALLLVAVGAINWGLVGAAHFLTDGGNWNLVNLLLGGVAWAEFGAYLLVGLAGIYAIYFAYRLTMDRSTRETPERMDERRTA